MPDSLNSLVRITQIFPSKVSELALVFIQSNPNQGLAVWDVCELLEGREMGRVVCPKNSLQQLCLHIAL